MKFLPKRLTLSIWPFVLFAPAQTLALAFTVRLANPGLSSVALMAIAALTSSLVVLMAVLGVVLLRRARVESITGVTIAYSVLAIASGALLSVAVQVVVRWMTPDVPDFPALLTILYAMSRPIDVLLLAVVVEQFRQGLEKIRDADQVVRESLTDVQRANQLLDQAEHSLRQRSLSVLRRDVEQPLRTLIQQGEGLSDQGLADQLDTYVSEYLRPLAHQLHPVSVRVGLIPALRTLSPDIDVIADSEVERFDATSALLDEGVRLQVYRWVRENITENESVRVSITCDEHVLIAEVTPAGDVGTLDAVQQVAGLQEERPGLLIAPRQGRVPPAAAIARTVPMKPEKIPRTLRMTDVFTVPLKRRTAIVALLALGSAPLQFVVFRWDITWATLFAVLSYGLGAIAMSALLSVLPRPQPTWRGVVRVFAEWCLIAAMASVAFGFVTDVFGLAADPAFDDLFGIFRGLYRFTIPGLLLVMAHGFLSQSRAALSLARAELQAEELRREGLLAESQVVDRKVAEVLHRTVQGRLSAALILIRLGRRDEAWPHVVEIASIEIPILLSDIQRFSTRDLLMDEDYPGLAIHTHGSLGDVSEQFIADLRAVASEIAVNAQRHGGARNLEVTVMRDVSAYTVRFCDDGTGLPREFSPGLGSRLLDEIVGRHCGTWSISSLQQGGCCVDVRVPAASTSLVTN
jgi:hypothetical protein